MICLKIIKFKKAKMNRITVICLIISFLISCGGAPRPILTTTSGIKTYPGTKIVQTNGKKTKEIDVLLQFANKSLVIKCQKEIQNINYEIPYDLVNKIVYEQTKHLRHKGNFLYTPILFLTSKPPQTKLWMKKHWLTICYLDIENQKEYLKLRLNEKYYIKILGDLEVRTGLIIERHEVE